MPVTQLFCATLLCLGLPAAWAGESDDYLTADLADLERDIGGQATPQRLSKAHSLLEELVKKSERTTKHRSHEKVNMVLRSLVRKYKGDAVADAIKDVTLSTLKQRLVTNAGLQHAPHAADALPALEPPTLSAEKMSPSERAEDSFKKIAEKIKDPVPEETMTSSKSSDILRKFGINIPGVVQDPPPFPAQDAVIPAIPSTQLEANTIEPTEEKKSIVASILNKYGIQVPRQTEALKSEPKQSNSPSRYHTATTAESVAPAETVSQRVERGAAAVKAMAAGKHWQELNRVAEIQSSIGGAQDAVVMFYASWCPTSKKMLPIFKAAATKNQDLKFIQVDADKHVDVSDTWQVKGFPTIKYFPGHNANKHPLPQEYEWEPTDKGFQNWLDRSHVGDFLTMERNPKHFKKMAKSARKQSKKANPLLAALGAMTKHDEH